MTIKRLICLLLAFVLAFAAAGCGGAEPNQADTDAVTAAVDKFRACTSFNLVQLTEIEEMMKVEGEKIVYDMLNEMQLSIVTEPALQMMTMTAARMEYDGEQMDQFSISYLIPEDGGYAEYFSDGGEWTKLRTDVDVSRIGIGAAAIVDTFFTDRISFCKTGEDTLDNIAAVRYEGALGRGDLMALLEANGQLSGIESMSENQQNKIRENLLKDLDEVTVTVWINEESGYPVRFEVDMAEVLNDMEKSIAKSLGNKASEEDWKMEKYIISMKLSDFNAVNEIILPPEAADARLYEGA